MNKYNFEDIEINHEEKFTYELNEDKMKSFLDISPWLSPTTALYSS